MREELQKREGRRGEFTAVFVRHSERAAFRGPPKVTLLFRDVRDEADAQVTDHLWFTDCNGWQRLGLQGGEKVTFTASVRPYTKGCHDRRERDYKLAWPKNIRIHSRVAEPDELILQFP
jgi:hypothetical protein